MGNKNTNSYNLISRVQKSGDGLPFRGAQYQAREVNGNWKFGFGFVKSALIGIGTTSAAQLGEEFFPRKVPLIHPNWETFPHSKFLRNFGVSSYT
jgi:hypothetical protein